MVWESSWNRLQAPEVKADPAEAVAIRGRPRLLEEDTSPEFIKARAALLM